MQWAGRSNVLFICLRISSEASSNPMAGILLLVWALSEVIRYPWALLTTLKACPKWLVWIRYTAFMALYPVGFVSEALLIKDAVPAVHAAKFWAVSMPNPLNFAFDWATLLQGLVYVYPLLSLYMYMYMLAQRKKKLSGKADDKKRN